MQIYMRFALVYLSLSISAAIMSHSTVIKNFHYSDLANSNLLVLNKMRLKNTFLRGGSSNESVSLDEKWMEKVARNFTKLGKASEVYKDNLDVALLEAARIGHDALIKHLIQQGAAVNACTKSVATANNAQVGDQSWKSPVSHTALHTAAGMGHAGAVQTLLSNGADPNLRDGDGSSPLHWATMHGHSGVIAVLIGAGADVHARDCDGFTPLHCAASQSHDPRLTAGFLAVAAGPIEARAMASRRDRCGDSPLHYTALYGHAEAARALLRAGASATAANGDGITPVHNAAAFGHAEVLATLLSNESRLATHDDAAGLDAADRDGNTALHTAVYAGQPEAAAALLAAGADAERRNKAGESPAAAAAAGAGGHTIAALFRSFAAAAPAAPIADAPAADAAAAAESVEAPAASEAGGEASDPPATGPAGQESGWRDAGAHGAAEDGVLHLRGGSAGRRLGGGLLRGSDDSSGGGSDDGAPSAEEAGAPDSASADGGGGAAGRRGWECKYGELLLFRMRHGHACPSVMRVHARARAHAHAHQSTRMRASRHHTRAITQSPPHTHNYARANAHTATSVAATPPVLLAPSHVVPSLRGRSHTSRVARPRP
jgi:ankyrin repeat protein